MAVYTNVSAEEASVLLQRLRLGKLQTMQGCTNGIENTNYFLSTVQDGVQRDYVLTLFERLTREQLPFYLRLMKHLAERGIPVPDPSANAQGELLFELNGKPAAVVSRLPGRCELSPTPVHCAAVGAMLARMHLAGADFALQQPNLRGLAWWNETVPVVLPHVTSSQAALLTSELACQNKVAASPAYTALPRGPIHADLFRDNVMFEDSLGAPRLAGFFDFYFAGVDSWLFDIAVCLNDWCVNLDSASHNAERCRAFLGAYGSVRPLQAAEHELLPAMLRAGALRFWISRLWDYYLPRRASVLKAHDPRHFEQLLRERVQNAAATRAVASCA